MIEFIADLVSEKAIDIAHQEIGKYAQDHPEAYITEEMKAKTVERAISQLSFNLNSFLPGSETDKEEIKKLFDSWFTDKEEQALRTTCVHCLDSEIKKMQKDEDPNLSFLDRYLLEHKKSFKKY